MSEYGNSRLIDMRAVCMQNLEGIGLLVAEIQKTIFFCTHKVNEGQSKVNQGHH